MTMFNGIDGMQNSLEYHLFRQNLISGNLANVDTPGYAPREILRNGTDFSNSFSLEVRRTNNRHMNIENEATTNRYDLIENKDEIPGNDLNYVSIDQEMSKMNANSLRYETVTKLVTTQLGILNYAAMDRR